MEEDEAPSGASSITSAPPAAAAAAAAGPVKYDASFFPGRRLTASMYKDRLYIHIREFTEVNGKSYPSKKGASLTPGRLSVLRSNMEKIDTALRQLEVNASYGVDLGGGSIVKEHLGGGIYVTVNDQFNGVNFRKYWMPPEGNATVVPTKKGIFLPASQWTTLKRKIDELLAACPDLLTAEPCSFSHQNQMGMLECPECMPFGWMSL